MTTEDFKRDILRLQPRLQRVAERIVGDPDSAADAVQEAVITLWEQRSSLQSQDLEKLAPTVAIYSIDGRLAVETFPETSQSSTISIANLIPGLYLIKVRMNDGKEFSEKIVVK